MWFGTDDVPPLIAVAKAALSIATPSTDLPVRIGVPVVDTEFGAEIMTSFDSE